MLDQVEGFISVERFQSLTDPRKILSLSFFEDETAISRWRTFRNDKSTDNVSCSCMNNYRYAVADGLERRYTGPVANFGR